MISAKKGFVLIETLALKKTIAQDVHGSFFFDAQSKSEELFQDASASQILTAISLEHMPKGISKEWVTIERLNTAGHTEMRYIVTVPSDAAVSAEAVQQKLESLSTSNVTQMLANQHVFVARYGAVLATRKQGPTMGEEASVDLSVPQREATAQPIACPFGGTACGPSNACYYGYSGVACIECIADHIQLANICTFCEGATLLPVAICVALMLIAAAGLPRVWMKIRSHVDKLKLLASDDKWMGYSDRGNVDDTDPSLQPTA